MTGCAALGIYGSDAFEEALRGRVAQRMVERRRALEMTQSALAQEAGVSLGTVKRFERTHQITLASLVRIACALDSEGDFDALFSPCDR